MAIAENQRFKLGVDIGGTFTDLVLVDEEAQQIFVGKELTTPDDPSQGVMNGLTTLLKKHNLTVSDLNQVVHATTLVTNAIIERKGSKTGLITTKGFRDILEMAREVKYELYDIFLPIPKPLISRSLRTEVSERTGYDGEIINPLDKEELENAVKELVDKGVESIAICFLHSYQNAHHEEEAVKYITENYPTLFVSASSLISPEIREYERMNTTAANAYVQPLTESYMKNLTDQLTHQGFEGNLYMMLSSGGLTGITDAMDHPIRLLESGPAAGTLVGSFYAQIGRRESVLAFDMGGTTAKMCIVDGGKPEITYMFEAARERRFKQGSGLPLRVPSVELIEIGAGGGSLASTDELGLLKVGPESAGSSPGPACYSRGGVKATVTDANLVLGYYNPDSFLGGEMKLDLEAARSAVARIASELEVTIEEAAWGIHNIVNEQMASAARIHVAEKGRDARKYTLLSTGGGGPSHAGGIAKKLQLEEILCPPSAGVASAFGLLVAPPRVDLVKSMPIKLEELDVRDLAEIYQQMEKQALEILADIGIKREQVKFNRIADMRYIGQGFEIQVPLPDGPLEAIEVNELESIFTQTYLDSFTRVIEGAPVEGLTWRLTAEGTPPSLDYISVQQQRSNQLKGSASKGIRKAYFPEWGEYREVEVFDRYALGADVEGEGPAIIEELESTAVVPPGMKWKVDEMGALIMTMEGNGNGKEKL